VRLRETQAGFTLLLEPLRGLGRARLSVVDQEGSVRTVLLGRVAAGATPKEEQAPGLAVDRDGGRAFVVTRELVGEVDLGTLAVEYRSLPRRTPAAAKKGEPPRGSYRYARWLGGNRLAFWGTDVVGSGLEERRFTATGLRLLDTAGWSVSSVDGRPGGVFTGASGRLLASGTVNSSEPPRPGDALGLTGYDVSGARRFRLFGRERVYLAATAAGRAYVYRNERGRPVVSIVDLETGRLLRTHPGGWRVPGFLSEQRGSVWAL